MARGYIWYKHFGSSLWDYSYEWDLFVVPIALMGSFLVALGISILVRLVCKRDLPAYLSGWVYFTCYIAGWIYISLLVSKTYIVNFGNTWTNIEIISEIIFVVPFFAFIWIVASGWLTQLLLKKISLL